MKRFLAIALIATVGLIYSAGSASADGTATVTGNRISGYSDGLSANGVSRSGHNLGIFGMHVITGWDEDGGEGSIQWADATDGTSEVCVFCHTPHHTRASGIGPLWNRGNTYMTFTPYGGTIGDDVTSDGGYVNNAYAAGASSVACYSCHDGVTKFDMLLNAPGAGGVVFGTAVSQGWTFREKKGSTFGNDTRLSIGADTAGIAGNDLSNDHPIGMEYRSGEVASLREASTKFTDIDLITGHLDATMMMQNRENVPGGPGAYDDSNLSQNKWAVYGFINTDATIQMVLKGSGTNATVECGSCHDPHFSNRSWGENEGSTKEFEGGEDHANGLFLRRVGGNAGSGLCRSCHDK